MTTTRLRALLLLTLLFTVAMAAAAHAQVTATPTPTVSPSVRPVDTNARIIGLVYLTAFAAAGYFLSRWLRRKRPPRPPGPFTRR